MGHLPKAPRPIESSFIERSLLSLRDLFGVESGPSSAPKLARDIIYGGKIQASF